MNLTRTAATPIRLVMALSSWRLVLARPHRAGMPFIAGGLGLAAAGLFLHPAVAAAGLGFAAFCAFFFRDPERVVPPLPGAILAPADGHIVSIVMAAPPPELGLGEAPRWRIATFLSIIDVHINRVPANGTVMRIAYRAGRFLDASLDKASETNERNALAIALPGGGTLAVVQIAGLVARRIVCEPRERDTLAAGDRFGLIRFGSRTDLYLPEGITPLVSPGQIAVGGETVMAIVSPS